MSNKTLPKPAEKTASAPKLLLVVALVIGLVGLSLAIVLFNRSPATTFGNRNLRLERVSSPQDIERGLSGRLSMPEDQGMLFIFDEPGKQCFWMKGMKFALDIIWLDEYKKVVTLKESVQPDSYPDSFCPSALAQYVIEVNAGVADKAYVSEGSQLQF